MPESVANSESSKRESLVYLLLPVVTSILGILAGAFIGVFAAHHFPFYGGIAMLGAPYSPARSSLVPGHMLLCGVVLGSVGLAAGLLLVKIAKVAAK